MNREKVRIGLAVRTSKIRINIDDSWTLKDGSGRTVTLESGHFLFEVSTPSHEPVWSARVHTFLEETKANALRDEYLKHGIDARVRKAGRPVNLEGGTTLDASVYSVLIGQDEDTAKLTTEVRALLSSLPVLKEHLPGWKRYEDELPRFDLVREAPPEGGMIVVETKGTRSEYASPVRLMRPEGDGQFKLEDVRIGIDFHWDHHEALPFRGSLEVYADGNNLTAVNELPLDDYLASVLGSEMRNDWPVEALAAQAVAARSTVLATRGRHHDGEPFDLCHDDHCQDYQGVSREGTPAREALERTKDWLIVSEGRIVDARFAKTCGGLSDFYATAWDDDQVPGLTPAVCGPCGVETGHAAELLKLGIQGEGKEVLDHILANPPSWAACNPVVTPYPESVRSMEQLYRWQRTIAADAMNDLVRERSGTDLGEIQSLEPLEYGVSGRIVFLRIHGTNGNLTIGKELVIRRYFSDTHLPSSAFKAKYDSKIGWIFEGIGWGHGVGLCQMGAASLAGQGWSAKRLLEIYYPGTELLIP